MQTGEGSPHCKLGAKLTLSSPLPFVPFVLWATESTYAYWRTAGRTTAERVNVGKQCYLSLIYLKRKLVYWVQTQYFLPSAFLNTVKKKIKQNT